MNTNRTAKDDVEFIWNFRSSDKNDRYLGMGARQMSFRSCFDVKLGIRQLHVSTGPLVEVRASEAYTFNQLVKYWA